LLRAVKDDPMARDDAPEIEEAFAPVSVVERFGKYRSLGRIGQGGMADVFLAVGRGPAGFNKLVVIKRLRDNVASDTRFCDMFLDEARLAARLNHPNIVQTYEVSEHEGAFFITMEYLEGQPLSRIARVCRREGIRLEAQIHARIISDVLCGLDYAHCARDFDGTPLNIVHRDVSPQNIFVTYNGQVKVVDFGIAKAERSNTKTQIGFFKGKAAYMAPEQLDGGAIDRRVDVFTAGIVLWELLVGKRLMAAESTAKTLVRLLQETVPRVSASVPDIDPKLDAIVARALQRDPNARYQTAGEMHDALEQYLLDGHHLVRHEDIGRIVSEAFGDARAELQREIRTQMAHASEFPRTSSGTMAIAGVALAPPSVDSASMSGIGTLASASFTGMQAAPSGTTGIIIAERPSRNVWITSALVAAIAAVSVAVIFTLVERAQIVAAPPPPVPIPIALAPAATHPDPQPTAEATDQDRSREPVHGEPAAPAPAVRPVQPPAAWRPGRPAEPRPAPQPRPAAPSAAAAVSAPSMGTALPNAAAEPTTVRPPSPPPSAPAPSPTQEGRRFRTSL